MINTIYDPEFILNAMETLINLQSDNTNAFSLALKEKIADNNSQKEKIVSALETKENEKNDCEKILADISNLNDVVEWTKSCPQEGIDKLCELVAFRNNINNEVNGLLKANTAKKESISGKLERLISDISNLNNDLNEISEKLKSLDSEKEILSANILKLNEMMNVKKHDSQTNIENILNLFKYDAEVKGGLDEKQITNLTMAIMFKETIFKSAWEMVQNGEIEPKKESTSIRKIIQEAASQPVEENMTFDEEKEVIIPESEKEEVVEKVENEVDDTLEDDEIEALFNKMDNYFKINKIEENKDEKISVTDENKDESLNNTTDNVLDFTTNDYEEYDFSEPEIEFNPAPQVTEVKTEINPKNLAEEFVESKGEDKNVLRYVDNMNAGQLANLKENYQVLIKYNKQSDVIRVLQGLMDVESKELEQALLANNTAELTDVIYECNKNKNELEIEEETTTLGSLFGKGV